MNEEPKRAMDDTGVSEELRELLELAPDLPTMTADLKLEIGARLTEHLLAAGAVGAATTGTSLLAKLLGTKILPMVGVGLVMGGGLVGYLLIADREPPAARELAESPTPQREAPSIQTNRREEEMRGPSAEAPVVNEDPPLAPASSSFVAEADDVPVSPLQRSGPSGSSNPLVSENDLIDRARSQLAESPSRALRTLAEHQRSFPAGQLASERELLTMQALGQLERYDEQRACAERFLEQFPRSPYQAFAEEILGPGWAAPNLPAP